MSAGHLSFLDQTFHYFMRPHDGLPDGPVDSPAAWRGADLDPQTWSTRWTADEIAEIDTALNTAEATSRALVELTRDEFPLPTVGSRLDQWRHDVGEGRGFVLIRGLPVEDWGPERTETVFWCLGLHLGRPGEQSTLGDLLGHVTDVGDDATVASGRAYRTAENIRYHCDAADVVGLLCLNPAKEGGLSRLVSSVTVFNTMLVECPDLVARLFEPFELDRRDDEADPPHVPVEACRFADGRLSTFFHADYFRWVTRHPGVELSAFDEEVLDAWEEIAERPELRIDMELAAGDLQLVNNHTVAHARTGYVDHDDPNRRRHLLRLWLSLVD